jgi:very-short-patch-repair endonuclease
LERERELIGLGMMILRFENKVILEEIEKMIEKINSIL